MKIATWNVNSLAVRLPQLLDWLKTHSPDLVTLQETKLTDDKFPSAELEAAGYRALAFGQKTYNGVALLSRCGVPDEVLHNIPAFDDASARVISGRVDGVRVVGAYFPNGQAPGSEKFAYKMQWLRALMCTIPCSGPARSIALTRSASTSAACSASGCTMPSACSSRRPRAGAGGTTATSRSARTRGCASTTSW